MRFSWDNTSYLISCKYFLSNFQDLRWKRHRNFLGNLFQYLTFYIDKIFFISCSNSNPFFYSSCLQQINRIPFTINLCVEEYGCVFWASFLQLKKPQFFFDITVFLKIISYFILPSGKVFSWSIWLAKVWPTTPSYE